MQTKYGFTKMTVQQFEHWVSSLRVARTITRIQQHHTMIPSYVHFTGNNHFERQRAMKNYHITHNGMADIAQHFTIFPDGIIMTGRSLEQTAAGIKYQNAGAICFEFFGNFDKGKDVMTLQQKDAIIAANAALCKRFNLTPNTDTIVYHHWYRLNNGFRNNGAGGNKSCPGTNFFGGNKVEDCQKNFIPLIKNKITGAITPTNANILGYAVVNTASLNIRTQASSSSSKANDRQAATFGAVLRIYERKNGFIKISNSQSHWVAERFTIAAKLAQVNISTLNVRSGASVSFEKIGQLTKDELIFITEQNNGWAKIAMDNRWVSEKFLMYLK
jgi:hypothetical protein